ncbi:MAG: aminoglycoside phosphotransferase family protein [Dehalococcoidia bacterium]|nr:MAG: aminoglycoside phosphotransferase family protein [Dehalococcoidia bacterium]
MRPSDIPRAVEAALASASAAGLSADDATVINDSNQIAVRLLPADALARVAYEVHQAGAEFEVEVGRRLTQAGSPVGTLDPRVEPRVHLRDGFAVTLWTYYESLPSGITPPEYAQALLRLHASMGQVEMVAPHFTDRVASARSLLADRVRTPELGDADRELLNKTLDSLTASITSRGAEEQLLHGEPHPGNLLHTRTGPLFVDLETCCRGPVEFDIAHAPEEVAEHYPGVDEDLLVECRTLMLAMITTWRWDREDQLPNGRQLAAEWLSQLRTALDRHRLDVGR